jgi:hypothetical protein
MLIWLWLASGRLLPPIMMAGWQNYGASLKPTAPILLALGIHAIAGSTWPLVKLSLSPLIISLPVALSGN